MKFTLRWLKEHLDTSASLDDISKTLTAIGLEVESVTDRAAALAPFTVAKILHAEKHPEADKLSVCKVQSDAGELQIVCGAPNARAGIFVALAKEGAVIPANGMVIKKTKIRGVESNGMLCSASELALGMDSAGIIELPEAKIGTPIADVLGLNDPVIEIAITPNRADALGVHGIARDLAAAGIGRLKPLPTKYLLAGGKWPDTSPVSVTIEDETDCPMFVGCTIENVKNAQSPDWLKCRLEAIGLRPISALVDITNYITFDLARPLHVYDIKKLKGNIRVTRAREGEKFQALDGQEYELDEGMITINDNSGPLALGGIIGGTSTAVDENTTGVFLECALFNSAKTAETGRKLGINSDARYRFERGVDPSFVENGALAATALILSLCGGKYGEFTGVNVNGFTLVGKNPHKVKSILLRFDFLKNLSGVNINKEEAIDILAVLGFECADKGNALEVTPPSWRADVEGEADLVEEILRIHGYDNIPTATLPKLPGISKPLLSNSQKRVATARRLLASRGFMEACTWSFLPEAQAKMFGGFEAKLKLLNPISADLDTMRPSLLPNLLDAAKRNAFRGIKNITLFEAGLQFHDVTPTGQRMAVSAIRSGSTSYFCHSQGLMEQSKCSADAFAAKADALAVLQSLGLNKCDATATAPAWYHPGRSGALTLGGKIILGYFGELHPAIASAFEIEGSVAGFELFLDAIPQARSKGRAKSSLKLSDFQAVERDFAFTLDDKITAAQLLKSLAQANKELITNISLFDVYTGKGVDAGKKSVAVKVTLQAMDRTLSDADITSVSQAIVAAAASLGGQLRQ